MLKKCAGLLTIFMMCGNGVADGFSAIPVLHLVGQIVPSLYLPFCQQLKKACANPEARAIIIHADSGGGDSFPSFFGSIEECNVKKPIWVLVQSFCASACYHAAVGAHRIIADPMATIGSIGVRSDRTYKHSVRQPINDDHTNATVEVVSLLKGKDNIHLSEYEPITAHEYRVKNEQLQVAYDVFVGYVRLHRPRLTRKNLSEWADARLFSAHKALELGLIDQIGSLSDVFDEIVAELNTDPGDLYLEDDEQFVQTLMSKPIES